jgi:chromosome segregation ATPase
MKDVDAIRVKAANAVTALADLNATLAASYQSDVHVLRETVELQGKELARLNHANGEQGKELSVLREANHSLARNCAEESNRASALQTELNSVSSKLKIAAEYERELKELIIDIRREAGEAKEQLAEAETKNRELSAEFAKASEALAKYDEQSEFHKWTNGDFANQIAAVRQERDHWERCFNDEKRGHRRELQMRCDAERAAEANKKAFEEADEERGKLKQALQDLATERDALREANEAYKKQIDQYEGEIDSLNRSFDASRQKRHADHTYALKSIEQANDREKKTSELLATTKDELDACKKELTSLRTNISRLERELREEKAAHERAVNDALDISRMIRV